MDTLVENINYYNQIKENLIKSEIYDKVKQVRNMVKI